jgi:hypothetical protein
MIKNTAFQWPLPPSTVSGLAVLAGTFWYLVTGDQVWAGVTAAAVKILVPDNSMGGEQVFTAIAMLASAAARPLQAPPAHPSVASGAPRIDRGPGVSGGPGEMTSDQMRVQG